MQAQHHRVCSLGEGIAFFVVSDQKDGDSADNSATSSYGLMRSDAVTGTHFSRSLHCSGSSLSPPSSWPSMKASSNLFLF
jgi:hypothetical protein